MASSSTVMYMMTSEKGYKDQDEPRGARPARRVLVDADANLDGTEINPHALQFKLSAPCCEGMTHDKKSCPGRSRKRGEEWIRRNIIDPPDENKKTLLEPYLDPSQGGWSYSVIARYRHRQQMHEAAIKKLEQEELEKIPGRPKNIDTFDFDFDGEREPWDENEIAEYRFFRLQEARKRETSKCLDEQRVKKMEENINNRKKVDDESKKNGV